MGTRSFRVGSELLKKNRELKIADLEAEWFHESEKPEKKAKKDCLHCQESNRGSLMICGANVSRQQCYKIVVNRPRGRR